MVLVLQHGWMDEYIKDNIQMIKCMVLEHFAGLMEENIKEIGKMESNMEEVNIFYQMVNLK
jgi:hypothetical protein